MINICQFFPERLRQPWLRIQNIWDDVTQIRIRVNQPVLVELQGEELSLKNDKNEVVVYGERDVEDVFRYLCHDSVYAYENERMQGYMTVEGGHRIGIAGEIVQNNKGYILKYVRYLNIRVAKEITGVSERIMGSLYENGAPCNILIISPPGIGKTTMLRDIVRNFSNKGYTVGLVDERGEIAAAYRGGASFDCGIHTDVITGGDKENDVSIFVRTFAPKVVAMDEIGSKEDSNIINMAKISGCKILATAHGVDFDDVLKNPKLKLLIENDSFSRFIFLSKVEGERYAVVCDERGNRLCGERL